MLFIAGGAIFWQWQEKNPNARSGDFLPWREKQSGYPLINPLLGCQFSEDVAATDLLPLKESISKIIATGNKSDDVAFYFRRLNDGAWTGINEEREFDPASLLKVPLAIAYLRYAEHYSGVMDKTLVWEGNDYNEGENIQSLRAIASGKPYTVTQLLEAMLTESDNNAFLALYHNIYKKFLTDVYGELGLSVSADGQVSTVSPKQYSLFFRILYNASYLNRENSEYAMDMLSRSSFQNGIAKPLPRDVVVAHKFGERGDSKNPSEKELHDCGVVFYAKNPYILCVMTQGPDFGSLENLIQKISARVFAYVSGGK